MSENVSSGLMAFNKANQFLFIGNREQSNLIVLPCKSTARPRVFDVLPAPLSQKGQSTRGHFWRATVWSEKSCGTRTGQIVQSTSAQKGAREGESQQAVRSSLLWVVETGSVVLYLPNQGLGDLMQNQQIQGGKQSGSSPCTLLSFGFSGHRVRQMPKAQVAGGDSPVRRRESQREDHPSSSGSLF